jgi:hypothetical protein
VTEQPPFGEALRAEFGAPRGVRRLHSSPRSRVWQVDLAGTPAIVKQIVSTRSADSPGAAGRYAREAAALRLAARVAPPVVPRLLATDDAERLLVLERLTYRRPPHDWIVDYAAALARLHAAAPANGATAGAVPDWAGPTGADADSFLAFAHGVGAAIPASVEGELADLITRLEQAPRNALLHGDPCPGNDLHTAAGVRFVDFERASFGCGWVELAYLRFGFPTCGWATAPPPRLLPEAEAAYHAAWRDATGTDPAGDPVDVCAGWLIQGDALVEGARRGCADHLARAAGDDWTWGTATARERLVHRLGVLADLAADRPDLSGLRLLSAGLHAGALARWPALQPLPERRPDGR